MSVTKSPRYALPTHLDTPDRLDLPLLGMTVSVTMRQGVLSLFGGSLTFHLWEASLGLHGILGVLHWVEPVALAFLTYVLAVQQVRGRYLEDWAVVLSRYLALPKVFVWCREPPLASIESEIAAEQAQRRADIVAGPHPPEHRRGILTLGL